MKTEAIELADTIDNSEETTGFERRMASVMRGQAAEIERLKAELGDLPEAQAMLLSDCKRKGAEIERLKAEAELSARHVGLNLACKDVEIERLTTYLKKANDQGEHFEREWYLRGDAIERKDALLREALVALKEMYGNSLGFNSEGNYDMVMTKDAIAAIEEELK